MKLFLTTLVGLALMVVPSWGMEIDLSWAPVSHSEVAGYKVYYSSTTPDVLNEEAGSPLDVGNVTSTTLTGLTETVYYIAVTAYSAGGDESPYSNVVCSTWMPTQSYPAEGETNVPVDVEFQWSLPPNPGNYTFTVYYGPVGGPMTEYSTIPPVSLPTLPTPPAAGLALIVLCGLSLTLLNKKKLVRGFVVCSVSAMLLTSCGGGGSDYTMAAPGSGGGGAKALLEPNTTYQWKVVADDGSVQVESTSGTFTTGS